MSVRVLVSGASGRMGREVVKAVYNDADLELVGAVDVACVGQDAGMLTGVGSIGVPVKSDLASALREIKPDVMVDFTLPASVMANIRLALAEGVRPVVGTTGITEEQLNEIARLCAERGSACLVAPNFAIGAVLMMKFAAEAAKYMPNVEIIELHHDKKVDAPSGTALKTAEMIAVNRPENFQPKDPTETEKIPCARGGKLDGIAIHSVRLPGFVASQEVIFGGLGQSLTLRHDSIDRQSFMPGVVMAAKEIMDREGLIYGLEKLMD